VPTSIDTSAESDETIWLSLARVTVERMTGIIRFCFACWERFD
jgi:hypothetical protein